jgi:hypothetical protein
MNKNEYQFILVLFSFFKHFKNYYFNKILYKNCITSPTTRDVKKLKSLHTIDILKEYPLK